MQFYYYIIYFLNNYFLAKFYIKNLVLIFYNIIYLNLIMEEKVNYNINSDYYEENLNENIFDKGNY